jgi:O-antigen ligase
VFWHSSGTLGFPAQAIKSVVAPSELSQRDQSSDAYRVAESHDIVFTIKSSPLTGIGFGKPFYRPIPLPAITVFQLSQYITHNSILWVWMKVGVLGFLAMLYLFGSTISTGARNLLRIQRGPFAVVTFVSVAYVTMYAVFCYVDIGWDRQNMLLLGLAMAQVGSAGRLFDKERGDESQSVVRGLDPVPA